MRIVLRSFLLLGLICHVARADDLTTQLGVDGAALAKARAGQVVQITRADLSERDLAVGLAFTCKLPPDKVARELLHGIDFSDDPSVVSSHRISPGTASRDLESLHLSPGGAAEAKRYLSAVSGEVLNLSDGEIAAFRALPSSAGVADVEAQLRKMLLARYESYRHGGISAITPYARDKGRERDLGEGLRVFADAPPALKRYANAIERIVHDYPKLPNGAEEAFYFIVYDHDGRPTVTLRHRLYTVVEGVPMMIDRELYVSQGYNEMQALLGFTPLDGGTLVVYRADTGTDRVGGASQSMKHSIGRRMMAKQLKAIFERVKAKL